MRTRLIRAVALGYLTCEFLVASVFAQFGSVDQEHLALANSGQASFVLVSNPGAAQTFTVGQAGILSAVEVGLLRPTDNTLHTILVDIRRVIDNVPDFSSAGVLATRSLSSASLPTSDAPSVYQSRFTLLIDFRSNQLRVEAGDRLAIHLHNDGPPIGPGNPFQPAWWMNNPVGFGYDGYTGGDLYAPTSDSFPPLPPGIYPFNNDAHFRTYVLVPEPATALSLLAGAAGLLRVARCRSARRG